MNRIFVVASVLLVTCLGATAQQTKLEKIDRIIQLTSSNGMIDTIVAQVRNAAASQLPPNATPQQIAAMENVTSKITDLMRALVDKIRPDLAKIYAETYTDEEIDGVLAFYESPAGRALREKSPLVVEKSMKLMQTYMAELQPEIQRIVRENVH